MVLACRGCQEIREAGEEVAADLRRQLADAQARAHRLADEEKRARDAVFWAEKDLTVALDRAHRAERRVDGWYVEALEAEIRVGRHTYKPGPGVPGFSGTASSCMTTGCGRTEGDRVHRTPEVVRAEAARRRNLT